MGRRSMFLILVLVFVIGASAVCLAQVLSGSYSGTKKTPIPHGEAQESKVTFLRATDIPYTVARDDQTRVLDIYSPVEGRGHPVVVWIHNTSFGSKEKITANLDGFLERGYVFVSLNFRLLSSVTYKEQADDIASAVSWIKKNIAQYGGNPDEVFLLGYSLGAHLAALVTCDESFLKAKGLPLTAIRGVALFNGAAYDIPKYIASGAGPKFRSKFQKVLSQDPAADKVASPATYVAPGKGIPPIQIYYLAGRGAARSQAERFFVLLKAAGVSVSMIPIDKEKHATLVRAIGKPGELLTETLFQFLKRAQGL